MAYFLLTHEVTVIHEARDDLMPKRPGTVMRIQFKNVIAAPHEAAAREQLVQYRYPGLQTQITDVQELGEKALTPEELAVTFPLAKTYTEDPV